jgi:ribonuclease T1
LAAAGSAMLVAAIALVAVWLNDRGDTATSSDRPTPSHASSYDNSARAQSTGTSPAPDGMPSVDQRSGLPYVSLAELPPEAAETIHLIDSGGPFPYDEDGGTFGNYEGLLPDEPQGYYKEYTVETPGSPDRGARRIIGGSDGQLYWTDDHYASFEVIWRATP